MSPLRRRFGPFIWIGRKFNLINDNDRPFASKILTEHLRQSNYPYWTAFFLPYNSIINDQFGWTNFNWNVDGHNYQILRLGCWPYIKYHCSRRINENLFIENFIFTIIKCLQFGIPSLAYGLSGYLLAKHYQDVYYYINDNYNDNDDNSKKFIRIYFWYKENPHSPY